MNRGKGKGSYFEPPATPTTIRLIPGEYKAPDGSVRPYYIRGTHYDVVTGKVRDCQGELCLMCHHRENTGKKKERFNAASMKASYTAVHMENYHLVEKVSNDGNKYKQKELCQGRRCPYCESNDPEVKEKIFGKKVHWTLSDEDHSILMAYDEELFRRCQCGIGEIFILSYECPKCLGTVLDSRSCALSEQELVAFGDNPQRCPKCGVTEFPNPIMECVEQDEKGEWIKCCDDPKPLNIFCVDLLVKGVQKTRRNGRTYTSLQIAGSEPKALDPRIKDLTAPYDFAAMFEVPLAKQADILELPIPDELRKLERDGGPKRSVPYES